MVRHEIIIRNHIECDAEIFFPNMIYEKVCYNRLFLTGGNAPNGPLRGHDALALQATFSTINRDRNNSFFY